MKIIFITLNACWEILHVFVLFVFFKINFFEKYKKYFGCGVWYGTMLFASYKARLSRGGVNSIMSKNSDKIKCHFKIKKIYNKMNLT